MQKQKVKGNLGTRVGPSIDVGKGPELRVMSKNQVNTSTSPLDVTGTILTSLKDIVVSIRLAPFNVVVKEVDKEVIGQLCPGR